MPSLKKGLVSFALAKPIYGAYTELFAGLSEDISRKNGAFSKIFCSDVSLCSGWKTDNFQVKPYGVVGEPRQDIYLAGQPKGEGGTGVGQAFWECRYLGRILFLISTCPENFPSDNMFSRNNPV